MNRGICNDPQIKTLPLLAIMGLGLGWTVAVQAEEETVGKHRIAGIDISGGITTFLQSTDGAPQNTTALSYSLDLGLEAPVGEHGKAVVALEAGDGLGVDATLGSLSTANYDAFYTNLQDIQTGNHTNLVVPSVSQAYYEGEYFDGGMIIDLGKLDVHSNYDDNAYANDETDQFMSAMFVRSPGTSYAELDRYYAPGIVIQYTASKMIDLTFIAANGNDDGYNDVFDYMYLVGQVNFKTRFGTQPGNYRFYAISDNRRSTQTTFTKISDGSNTSNTAWGLSFDQAVVDGVGLFARYSMQDDTIAENTVKAAWSLGTLLNGALWGRNWDTIGLGYGTVMLNDKTDLAAALGTSDTGDESHLEAFYKFGVSEQFTLTVDAQVINNNGGNAAADTVTVAGLRGQLNF
jgi:carbohydrate-selective porin OprB